VGSYLQTPPAYSAKKVDGRRAYAMARAHQPVSLSPVPVTVSRAELVAFDAGRARVSIECSAGFYVRSFAQAIGQAVGTGACLEALRRTRSGGFPERLAVPLGALDDPAQVQAALVPLEGLLADWPAVTTNSRGLDDVRHGRELGSCEYVGATLPSPGTAGPWVRVMDEQGALVAMATPGRLPASLHPSVVLI
jgi:tRNA pseudouridine55 synthase